jgi:hypothetical protein
MERGFSIRLRAFLAPGRVENPRSGFLEPTLAPATEPFSDVAEPAAGQ